MTNKKEIERLRLAVKEAYAAYVDADTDTYVADAAATYAAYKAYVAAKAYNKEVNNDK